MKNKLDRITLIMTLIIFSFSIIYGFFYYNRSMFKVTTNDNKITESDKKDTNISYTINSYDVPVSYDLVNHRYLSSVNAVGELSYYNLDGTLIYNNFSGEPFVGKNHKIYVLNSSEGSINISVVDKEEVKSLMDINTDSYYIVLNEVNNEYVFLGIVAVQNNKETLYEFVDDKVNEIESDNFYFIGDNVRSENDRYIYTCDEDHIVISKNVNSEYGVYDIVNKKVIINTKNKYIRSLGNNYYVIYNDNNAAVYDGNMKRMSITYDYITKAYDYYIAVRDRKMTILDQDLKVITNVDFPISDGINTKYIREAYDSLFHVYSYKDNLVLATTGVDTYNKIFLLNSKHELYSNEVYDFSITNFLYFVKDYYLHVLDDKLEEKYSIPLDTYFGGENIKNVYMELDGDTIVIRDEERAFFFDYETGTKIDEIKDYEISFTESIKIKVHPVLNNNEINNEITLYVGDNKVENLSKMNINKDMMFRKINKNYYLFTDNKIIKISKKG